MDNSLMIIDNLDDASIANVLHKIERFQQIIQQSLKPGHDYDTIPGTNKPSLLKPGAEKIGLILGMTPSYDFVAKTEDYNGGFFAYTIRCILFMGDKKVGEGLGSCNTLEKKYKTQDACTISNTILKMAKKRAHIDATLQIACMSDVFVAENNDLNEYRKNELIENMSLEDAANIKISFGKNKGRTLGDIYKNDFSWIIWFKKNGKDDLIFRAISVLENAVKEIQLKKQETVVEVATVDVDDDGVIVEEGESVPENEQNILLEGVIENG